MEWLDQYGQMQGTSVGIKDWRAGEPHSVTATWGDNSMSIYIDGKRSRSLTYEGEITVPEGAELYLGSRVGEQIGGADATLGNFKVYTRPLAPHEVRSMVPAAPPSAP